MQHVGPKETALRNLRAARPLAKHHQMMVADGCPPEFLREQSELKNQPKAEALPTPEQQEIETVATKSKSKKPGKKTAIAKARMPVAKTNGAHTTNGIRPGSKVELIAGLLKRPEGCTTADVLTATGWPAVSMPAQAKAAGLTLKKEKDGSVTRYRAA